MTRPPPPDPKHPKPWLSHAPWAGFSPRQHKREPPLAVCPSARCRRVKACVAAHGGVYCQRTHISQSEHEARQPKPERLLKSYSAAELELFKRDVEDRRAEARARFEALTRRWKAGEFDHLYGPWKAGGVLMHPPPKVYLDGRPRRGRKAKRG